MNESRYKPERVTLIRSALEQGESLLELCDFNAQTTGAVTGALTNRYVHFMTFRITKRDGWQVGGHATVPVSKISTIVVNQEKETDTWLLKRIVRIHFSGEGVQEDLTSRWLEEATDFGNHLRTLVNTREVSSGTVSIADEIAKLAQLANEGILTQDELSRAKTLFIGMPPNKIDESIHLLRQLKDLHRQGVLSESEFNMKKWDVMSKRDFQ
jgi:hypothetical protein